jgi:hypothetical protein
VADVRENECHVSKGTDTFVITTSTAKVKVHEKGTLVMHNRHARDKQCHRRCASMQLQVGRDFGLALEPKNYAPH